MSNSMRYQGGQAMSEFVAAMTFLFIPLFMGVVYVGKYGDIKHQAVQASRYAAMERALDPQAHESDGIVANETVARFFRDGSQSNIGLDDQATEATADENPAWSQMDGTPMLAEYSNVTVTLSDAGIDSASLKPIDADVGGGVAQFSGLKGGFGFSADVKVPVPLVNIAQFAPLPSTTVTIEAKTVIAGDPWNAGGAVNVVTHFTDTSIPGKLAALANEIPGLNTILYWLAGAYPVWGCVKPDVVPTATAPGATYDPAKSTGADNVCGGQSP